MAVLRNAAVLLAAAAGGCASLPKAPAPGVAELARATRSYSAVVEVRLQGRALRARTRTLVAFERPDKLRIEVPGPAGARFVALARGESLLGVFPGQRAVYRGGTSATEMERLLGVALTAPEVMDLLVGVPPRDARTAEVRWGDRLPRRVDITLADGSRLGLRIEDEQADPALAPQAFAPPRSEGYRAVDAAEARGLWSR